MENNSSKQLEIIENILLVNQIVMKIIQIQLKLLLGHRL